MCWSERFVKSSENKPRMLDSSGSYNSSGLHVHKVPMGFPPARSLPRRGGFDEKKFNFAPRSGAILWRFRGSVKIDCPHFSDPFTYTAILRPTVDPRGEPLRENSGLVSDNAEGVCAQKNYRRVGRLGGKIECTVANNMIRLRHDNIYDGHSDSSVGRLRLASD